jgi:hypothetical protein
VAGLALKIRRRVRRNNAKVDAGGFLAVPNVFGMLRQTRPRSSPLFVPADKEGKS